MALVWILLGAFLNRTRGGGSDWLARVTPVPRDAWRYASFVGFGMCLALAAGLSALDAFVCGLGMWQLGARAGGWTGMFGRRLGIDTEREDWMQGPLANDMLASLARGFVWGLGGVLPVWLMHLLLPGQPPLHQLMSVPAALAVAFAWAPPAARRITGDGWAVDHGFVLSRWGVMELLVGGIAGWLAWLL